MHGELFSYLCFAKELAEELIRFGRADARRWLSRRHEDGPWRVGPLPDEPHAPRADAQAGPQPRRRPRGTTARARTPV
jgi:hypothetical protein